MSDTIVTTATEAAAPAAATTQSATTDAEVGSSLLTGLDHDVATAQAQVPPALPKTEPAAPTVAIPAWAKQLPKDLQSDESTTRFATIGDAWAAFKALEGKSGSMTTVPGKDATQEERAAFSKMLGVPEKPEDYILEQSELPEGLTYDEGAATAFKAKAHELGLLPDQVKGLYAWANASSAETFKAASEAAKTAKDIAAADSKRSIDATVSALRKDWGSDYAKELATVTRFVKNQAKDNPTLASDLEKTGFGNSLSGIRLFAAYAKQQNPHGFVEGDGAAGTSEDHANALFGTTMKR